MFYCLFPQLATPGIAAAICELFWQLSQLPGLGALMPLYEHVFC